MSDIASFIFQDPKTGAPFIDWAMDGPDLAGEDGLATAVLISLFTDRLADADDVVPGAPASLNNGPPDRRGWWGDMPADPSASDGPPMLTGSRFWLRAGWPADDQTARRLELDAREALQWMLDSHIAQSIDVTTGWISRDTLALHVAIAQRGARGRPELFEYDYVWSPTVAVAGAPAQMAAPEFGILREDGHHVLTEDDSLMLDE